VLVTMLLCAVTLGAGYANKVRCVGPSFDSQGRSGPDYTIRIDRDVCYSDIQYLWIGRDVNRHLFPYVSGGYDPATEQLYGGAVEYPVLTGMAIYLAALPSSTDGEFLFYSALLLAIAGLLSAALTAARMSCASCTVRASSSSSRRPSTPPCAASCTRRAAPALRPTCWPRGS